MTAITQTSVNFIAHIQGIQRAEVLLTMIQKAVSRSDRRLQMAAETPFVKLQDKYKYQSECAAKAAARLAKVYEAQLLDLLVNRL